jgi:hypothetical protein
VLNLTGTSLTNQLPGATFNTAWATMQAQIVDVEIDFFHGKTVLHFGPHAHLSASEMFDLLMMWRWRIVWPGNFNLRASGGYGGDPGSDSGGVIAKENTEHASPDASLHTVFSPVAGGQRNQIQSDAVTNGGQLVMQSIDATGTPIAAGAAGKPQVLLIQDDAYDPVTPTTALLIKWRVCTLASGGKIRVAASQDFDAGGGGGWKGAYSGSVAYIFGDIVLYSVGGDSDGIYVWNDATASTAGTAPIYPPAGSHWQLIAFLPQSISYDDDTCTSQSRYVNSTPQL